MKWFGKQHMAELKYTLLLVAIFGTGYFWGSNDNRDIFSSPWLIPLILAIKVIAAGIATNTTPTKEDNETPTS